MPDHQLMTRRAAETRRVSLPLQTREAAMLPASAAAAGGTVRVCWTTGARRRTVDFWTGEPYDEELVVTPAAVDLTRFDAGVVQVLNGHDRHSGVAAILGIATRGWIENGQGLADLRLSERTDLAGIVADILAGIIRAVSFGYSVERYEITRAQDRTDGGTVDLWRAVRWAPQEISFVPVPADPGASPRSADPTHTRAAGPRFPCILLTRSSEDTMPNPNTIDDADDTTTATTTTTTASGPRLASDVRALVAQHRLPADFADALVQRGATMYEARAAVQRELARIDEGAGGHLNVSGAAHGGRDAREQMVDALTARMGGPSLQRENSYRHARLVDMARDLLEMRGMRTGQMAPHQIIERALHATSDFPDLLQSSGNRTLRQGYMSYQGGIKRIASKSTARDFRTKQRVMLGEAPELLKVNENGEFTYGSMADSKESYALSTFGRIFGITRQALVNDDLEAFADMAMKFGRAAAEFEAKFLVTLLTSNPVLDDGIALFHASHGNLGTGAGSALQETSLSSARAAMRLQKGLDGKTPIDATPEFLVVPAALETTGQKLLAAISPATSSTVNPFAQALQLVVDPRLDAVSATAWYLSASPAVVDTIEYSYLEGEEGPVVTMKEGFEVDGVQMKVRLDFGAGVQDFRGLYKANGA